MTIEIGSIVKMLGGQEFVVTELEEHSVCGIPVKENHMTAGPGSAGTLRPPLTETGVMWNKNAIVSEMTRMGFAAKTIKIFLDQFPGE